jgi:hypothetical protein
MPLACQAPRAKNVTCTGCQRRQAQRKWVGLPAARLGDALGPHQPAGSGTLYPRQ